MNARNVCMIILVLAGSMALPSQAAQAGEMPGSVVREVREQGEMAQWRIRMDQRMQARIESRQALAAMRPTPETSFPVVAEQVRLQGRLALWSIQEDLMADIRSGAQAERLIAASLERGAVSLVGSPAPSGGTRARDLLKTPLLVFPDFLPAVFR